MGAGTNPTSVSINSANSGIGSVFHDRDRPSSSFFRLIDPERDGARVGSETRPKNMKAVFIIRIE